MCYLELQSFEILDNKNSRSIGTAVFIYTLVARLTK